MRILIIDDNPVLVNIFAKMLRIKGFFVTATTTFKAGLQHLENELYHVVFVDAPLDDYNEKQILTMFQENQVFQKSFVFLLSSVDFDNIELDKWKKHGLYSYLKKPVKRSIVIQALNDVQVKTNFTNSQITSEPVVEDEEATPEQLARLEQLGKQIQELENIPQQLAPNLKNSQEKILVDIKSEPIVVDEDADPEQLARLEQLGKQIQELENIPQQLTPNLKNSQEKILVDIKSEPSVDVSVFKNIINDLRTFQSKFEHAEQHMKKSNIEPDTRQKEIIMKDIEKARSEISELKNEIQLLDEIDNQELQQNQISSIYKKKRKIKKRLVTRAGTKKRKIKKRLVTRAGTKKRKIKKRLVTRAGTKKISKNKNNKK